MRTSIRLAVVLTVVLLAASACAFSSEGPEPSPTPPPPSTTPATPPAPSTSPTDSGTASPTTPGGTGAALPEDVRTRPTVAAAIDDTASREGVTADQVVVAAWSPVTWTDGSLGCPQEGMSYTQDFPLERYMREAKVTQIFEGTNQIQRLVISRQLLRG